LLNTTKLKLYSLEQLNKVAIASFEHIAINCQNWENSTCIKKEYTCHCFIQWKTFKTNSQSSIVVLFYLLRAQFLFKKYAHCLSPSKLLTFWETMVAIEHVRAPWKLQRIDKIGMRKNGLQIIATPILTKFCIRNKCDFNATQITWNSVLCKEFYTLSSNNYMLSLFLFLSNQMAQTSIHYTSSYTPSPQPQWQKLKSSACNSTLFLQSQWHNLQSLTIPATQIEELQMRMHELIECNYTGPSSK